MESTLLKAFTNTVAGRDETDANCTRQAITGKLSIPRYKTTSFGLKCIVKKCINSWNKFTDEINKVNKTKFINKLTCPDIDLTRYSRTKLKDTINKHILNQYTD